MYTRCQHCEAIFRVNMREVTVANGKLRCGECHKVFSATNNLSTTIPEKFQDVEIIELTNSDSLSQEDLNALSAMDNWQAHSPASTEPQKTNTPSFTPTKPSFKTQTQTTTKTIKTPHVKAIETDIDDNKNQKGLIVALVLLIVLLAAQILYNNRAIFNSELQHFPEQVQMLNHNVFSHPNEPGVLLISASMQSNAKVDQPYPILEIKLTNSQSQTVALRRFKPQEYLDNYSKNMLLVAKQPTSLKLKIKDPGNNATRFQFNFY